MMSLLSGMMVSCNALTEKWKWGVQFIPSNMAENAFVCLLKNEELLVHKEDAKGNQQILKRQFGENNICWEVIFFQAEAWMSCILCEGNIPVSGLMQPNCRNWFPATTLGMFFWVWFDLWRLPWETVSISCSLLEVILLCQINLSTLSPAKFFFYIWTEYKDL